MRRLEFCFSVRPSRVITIKSRYLTVALAYLTFWHPVVNTIDTVDRGFEG